MFRRCVDSVELYAAKHGVMDQLVIGDGQGGNGAAATV